VVGIKSSRKTRNSGSGFKMVVSLIGWAPLLSASFFQTGVREGLLGVPRHENAQWRKSFIGGPKFVRTSVIERCFNYRVVSAVLLKNSFQ
jgi:hypothetical protein